MLKSFVKFIRSLLVIAVLFAGALFAVPALKDLGIDIPYVNAVEPADYHFENQHLFGFRPTAGQFSYEPNNVPADSYILTHQNTERTWHGYYAGNSETPRPTILLLHGTGRSGLAMIDMWLEIAKKEDLILIAPDAASARGWNYGDDGPKFLNAILAASQYPIDQNNIFVFGHSAGAAYSHMLANRTDGPWRAMSAHAGYLRQEDLTKRTGTLPIQFLLGEEDNNFDTQTGIISAQAFAELGHETHFISIAEHTHWYYAEANKLNAIAWAYFQKHLE